MDRNFQRALTEVLKSEGGYVNDPRDPGGATNKGVTLKTFRAFVNPKGTIADLKAITPQQVATVYRREYWDAVHGAELPDGLDYAVFDFGVNSGPSRAIKFLQRILGVAEDGRLGPVTLGKAQSIPARALIDGYQDARLAFLKNLPTWGTFGKGWGRRVSSVRAIALAMATQTAAPAKPAPLPAPAPAKPDVHGLWNMLLVLLNKLFRRKS